MMNMFNVFNVTDWEKSFEPGTGTRPKEWLIDPRSRRKA